jgi:hypothetical protein
LSGYRNYGTFHKKYVFNTIKYFYIYNKGSIYCDMHISLPCLCSIFVGLVGIPSFQAASPDESWVSIDFSNSTGSTARVDPKTWNLFIAGNEYPVVLKGAPRTIPVIIEDGKHGRALRIELDPTSGLGPDNGRDKINYTVIKGDNPNAPGFAGQTVFYAFALKLDPNEFMTPTTGISYVVAQWWQGTPFGPPLSLQILPSSDSKANPKINFVIRNDQTGGNPHAKTIGLLPKYTPAIERGKWYKFVVGTKFSFSGEAELTVWINNDSREEISWSGSMGYNPSLPATHLGFSSGTEKPNARLQLYFGPYRDRMNSTQVFYFDDISYGSLRPSAQ